MKNWRRIVGVAFSIVGAVFVIGVLVLALATLWQGHQRRNGPLVTQTLMAPPGVTEDDFRRAECERLKNPPPPAPSDEMVYTVHLAPPEGYTAESFRAALYKERCGDLDRGLASNASKP